MIIDNPFLQCSGALENRQRIKAVLLDSFPNERVKANVLVIAYDSGIALAIQNSKLLDDTFVLRFIKTLTSDYAIQYQMAKWAVQYWIEMYGVQVLGKASVNTLDFKPLPNPESDQNSSVDSVLPKLSIDPVEIDPGKKMEDFARGEKLSKKIIDIQMKTFIAFGINKFTCSVRADHTSESAHAWLKVTGEFEGSCSEEVLLVFMCFNPHDELIGVSYRDKTISKDFKGDATYSIDLQVPKWESVNRIVVRAIPCPGLIW